MILGGFLSPYCLALVLLRTFLEIGSDWVGFFTLVFRMGFFSLHLGDGVSSLLLPNLLPLSPPESSREEAQRGTTWRVFLFLTLSASSLAWSLGSGSGSGFLSPPFLPPSPARIGWLGLAGFAWSHQVPMICIFLPIARNLACFCHPDRRAARLNFFSPQSHHQHLSYPCIVGTRWHGMACGLHTDIFF